MLQATQYSETIDAALFKTSAKNGAGLYIYIFCILKCRFGFMIVVIVLCFFIFEKCITQIFMDAFSHPFL